MQHEELAVKSLIIPNFSPAHLHWAVQQGIDLLIKLSPEGDILAITSSQASNLLDMNSQALVGWPLKLFLDEKDAERFQGLLKEIPEAPAVIALTVQMLKSDGAPLWLEGVMGQVAGESPDHHEILAVFRDVTSWKVEQQRLQELNDRDVLTGLANRTALPAQVSDCIEVAKAQGQSFTFMALDLDGFKEVNDALGHSVGDALLKQASHRLTQILHPSDLIYRTGGDEFVILRPPAARTPAADTILAQKIVHSICRPFHVSGQVVRITVSIGIVRCPDEMVGYDLDSDTLLKNADLAMYDAKAHGKNSFSCFNQEMAKAKLRRQKIAEALFDAISNGEFELHYQPIHGQDGKLAGVEALMRWPRPKGEQYSPAEFIPIAESRGLISLLGAWALRTACHQAVLWQAQGLSGFYVAVNVSPEQFADEGFVRFVKQALSEVGLPPERLVLEITEGILMDNAPHVAHTLQELIALGTRIAIDDFGTGYSSLAYLKRFNLSILKIDKSFIDDIPHDTGNCTIVSAVLGMARELGLNVVAEGVETQEQLQWLQAHNCGYMQGYLLQRPAAAHQIFEKYRPESRN